MMKNKLISWSNISGTIGVIGTLYTIIFGKNSIASIFNSHENKDNLVSLIYYCSLVLVILLILPIIIIRVIPFFKNILKFIKNGKKLERLGIDYFTFMSAIKGSGTRINEYQALRKRAKHSVFIMGIGLTNVSKETVAFEEQIARGIKYRILIISPKLLDGNEKFIDLFGQNYFSRYLKSTGYEKEVLASYDRLVEFYKKMINNNRYGKEHIEIKEIIKGLFPINMTAIDYNIDEYNGELLFDFCFPLSTERLIFKLSKKKNFGLFNKCIELCDEIYRNYSVDIL